jgi:hypothetical protein
MKWDSEIEIKHSKMVENTPEAFRKLMDLTMKPKVEALAKARGAQIVEEKDFVLAWLSVPEKGRPGVIKGLTFLGVDVASYLAKLDSGC